MSARAVLEIRRSSVRIGEGINQHTEDEHGHGWFDYTGQWSDRHPDCMWAGICWVEHPDGVPVADLPRGIDDQVPVVLPDGQIVVPPEDVSNEAWMPVFDALLDLYRSGDFVAALLYGHS